MVRILVRGCRCATSWCDLDLPSDLAVVAVNDVHSQCSIRQNLA